MPLPIYAEGGDVLPKMKRTAFALWLVMVGLLLSACTPGTYTTEVYPSEEVEVETTKVIFGDKILGIAKMSPEACMEDLINTSEGNYEDIYLSHDGTSVTLEITEEQREYWLSSREGYLKKLQSDFATLGPGYKIEYSEDYTHIDLYYDGDLSWTNAVYYVIYTETMCVNMQLFSGVEYDQWKVSCNIYNSDTGKLVTSGDSDAGLNYTVEDWQASM